MSVKYIGQVNDTNFVYPNKQLAEYDVEIVHDINDNGVQGTITNFSASTVSTTGITFSYSWSWTKYSAEPFISDSGNLHLVSVHCLTASQQYYKPWRCVDLVSTGVTTGNTYSGTKSFTITPSQMGVASFTNGTYYFEFRFIGHRSIYPVCANISVSTLPTPTPTPTPTSPPTPTPTATPTPTPTGFSTYTSGATINVTDTGYIRYLIKGDSTVTYHYFGSLGTTTINDCIDCSTIATGFPLQDPGSCTVINCGNPC